MRPTTSTILFFFPESLTGSKPGSHSQCSLLPLVPSTSELHQSPPWSEKMRGEWKKKKKKVAWLYEACQLQMQLSCTALLFELMAENQQQYQSRATCERWIYYLRWTRSLTGNLSIALNSLFEVKSDSLLVLMHLRSWECCEICKQSEVLTDYPTVH